MFDLRVGLKRFFNEVSRQTYNFNNLNFFRVMQFESFHTHLKVHNDAFYMLIYMNFKLAYNNYIH